MTRSDLLESLVNSGEAEDLSQAGYFMSLISSQLGHEWKDYLRQVIKYEYPNQPWEKDNFSIYPQYIDLIRKVLEIS